MDQWGHGNFLCRNYILNSLSDTLYNVYSLATIARAPLGVIGKEIQNRGCGLEEVFGFQNGGFQNATTTMKDFKNYLKHKWKDMGLEDLIVRLRIEEDNRLSEMKSGKLQLEAKANLMEQNENTSIKIKRIDYKPEKGRAKMIKGNCYNCGKPN
ncbi:UNVERIFIED_CONTAM: hypothetical protein Scaly_1658900 [Sesamum calycinum]|uniref:Uncharacterized protein n=1 Tax=Sesamum calycinum TaxID=2727403 RepID=A0AAW2NRL8_9LAMI